MSALRTTTKASTNAYIATLKQEYVQRSTLGDVGELIGANMQEPKANSMRPVTEDQMARHRRITAMAAEFLFVRESEVFTLYLSSNVGQRLENYRWHHHPDLSDETTWQSSVQKLLSLSKSAAKGSIVAVGLLLAVVAMLHKLRSAESPLPVITPSIDPTTIHNTDLFHSVLPTTMILDVSTSASYLLGPSPEIISDTDRHLLEAPPAITEARRAAIEASSMGSIPGMAVVSVETLERSCKENETSALGWVGERAEEREQQRAERM